jgi:long-subunit fatty acid transport protein
VTLGASWRIISASLDRKLTNSLLNFDANLSGTNLGGFRVGAQWAPIPELSLGVVFRNKTTTTMSDDAGLVLITPERYVETDFTLPSKLGFGTRVDLDPLALALDVEYAFQSQNRGAVFVTEPALALAVNNIFAWQDGVTVRAGAEFDLDERFFFRGGYIWDSQVSQEKYPSAFGTPPAPTSTFTAGFGMKGGDDWKFNVALAHRRGAATVVEVGPPGECVACSFAGDYKLTMTGVYVDFMWSFDVGHKPGAEPVSAAPAPAEEPAPAESAPAEQPAPTEPAPAEQPAPAEPAPAPMWPEQPAPTTP